MSRPDRPFRATRVLANRTVHHDYATKEERDAATCTEDKRTTVTSRKPVKPGTPVCWVNVYEDSDGKRAGGFTHRTEGAAALSAGSAAIHCIPVYLPGEGDGRSMCPQEELNEALAEVERLTKELAAAKELTDDRIKEHRNQAFAAGQRKALADVRAALGIKEES